MDEVARLRHIIETQRLINAVFLDRQMLMNVVAERTQDITEADGGVVELVESDEMVYAATSGLVGDSLGKRFQITSSLSGRCARLGVPLRCVDTEIDTRVDQAACRRLGIRSMVVVPLVQGDDSVGVLKVVSTRPAYFGEADVKIMQEVAVFVADAVSNASRQLQSSLHDSLTGLANRSLLVESLEQACRRADRYGTPLAVLLIDLDGFGRINDRYGRSAGDAALVQVADRLTEAVRANDLIARLGDDEFALVCEDADEQSAQGILERIDTAVRLVAESEPRFAGLAANVGLAWRSADHRDPDELLSAADASKYRNKKTRRAGT